MIFVVVFRQVLGANNQVECERRCPISISWRNATRSVLESSPLLVHLLKRLGLQRINRRLAANIAKVLSHIFIQS